VLGAKENRKPCAVSRAQQIDISTTKVIDARVIRQQAEALTGNQMCRIREQNFDAGPDLGRDR